jgi:hypothetical protein
MKGVSLEYGGVKFARCALGSTRHQPEVPQAVMATTANHQVVVNAVASFVERLTLLRGELGAPLRLRSLGAMWPGWWGTDSSP